MSQIYIRPATSTDALILSSLCMDVQRLHAEHHPDVFKMPQQEDFAASFFDQMLADPTMFTYLAEENGQSLGYVFCKLVERPENPFTLANRFLHIDQISVRPAAQRDGVGSALIAQVESLAKELGITKIQLDSWDFNTQAHAFFERLGFQKFNYPFWRDV